MASPFRPVARGLRLVHTGYLTTCWGVASSVGAAWFMSGMFGYSAAGQWVLLGAVVVTLTAAVGGLVAGLIGRVLCLKMPEEYPAARGRILVATALEGCGWGGLLVGGGVALAMGFRLLPDAFWVPGLGSLFSLLLLFCGRVVFLLFLRLLAGVVGDAPSGARARRSLSVFVGAAGVALTGAGVYVGGSLLGLSQLAQPVGGALYLAAGMGGLAGTLVYDRLLSALRASVQIFADGERVEEGEADGSF